MSLTRPFASPPGTPLLASLWLHLRANLAICLGIAVFLSVLFGDPFWRNLVFSLCIGLSIQALIEAGRYAIARWRLSRGDDSAELHSGWPGWAWMGPWVLASALLGHSMGMLIAGWLTGTPVQLFAWTTNVRALFIVLSITLGVSVVFTYHFYSQSRLAAAQASAQAAERLASEHQLRLLQSQLEPHMLFNSLANLRVLIGLDPVRAQAMLDRMVAYLRATLSASRADHHPLAAEFARLDDYLALMAIRMGPRLQVSFDLPDALRELPVPPLLLQPLVENSIHHGLEPKVEGGRIEVRARHDGHDLLLTIRDTGVGLAQAASLAPSATPSSAPSTAPSTAGTGFGTAQVRERLQALFGDQARFRLEAAPDAEGGTLATLRMPWAPADADGAPPWARARGPALAPGPTAPATPTRALARQLLDRQP